MDQPRPLLLLVDDDEHMRQLLSEIGKREGFDILEAAEGASALDALSRRHVDLVFLDLHMPRVNGLDVLRAVRALHAFRRPLRHLARRRRPKAALVVVWQCTAHGQGGWP